MKDSLEVLDKIRNQYYIITPKPEFAVHPLNGELTDLKEMDEYKDVGMEITGVIFKEDGTTILLYKNIKP